MASHQRVAPASLPSGHDLARRKKGTVHGDDSIPRDDVIYVVDLVQIPREAARGWKMGGMELGKKGDDGSDSVKNDVHWYVDVRRKHTAIGSIWSIFRPRSAQPVSTKQELGTNAPYDMGILRKRLQAKSQNRPITVYTFQVWILGAG